MKKNILHIIFLTIVVFLTGCLYPQGELSKNQIPNDTQLEMVETAVLQYVEEMNGLVPIKTKANDVDIYEKYLIDFTTLKEKQLLSEVPATAYENGGVYQYIIITPEENPRVKLIDLRMTDKLREVYVKLDIYRSENIYPPYGDQIASDIYTLNYQKLGYDSEPYVVSPFTQTNLPIVITTEGELFVDYRMDLQQALNELDHSFQEGDDIRTILEDHYPFVPAYSLPYTIKNNEPVFLLNE